jgi:site-specific DNA-methyltransferase (adenine-specific)
VWNTPVRPVFYRQMQPELDLAADNAPQIELYPFPNARSSGRYVNPGLRDLSQKDKEGVFLPVKCQRKHSFFERLKILPRSIAIRLSEVWYNKGMPSLPLAQVLPGDCLDILPTLPAESVDLVFADPPYNLQLRQELWRPDHSRVDGLDDDWDRFADFAAYDAFTRAWLSACRRVLKPTGTLWVIGSYHNIYRVGSILQDLDYWILNDLVWIKTNPMPNFRGVRFTNAHETLLWAQKARGRPYTFNYQAMKALNEDLQMRSDWYLPLCTGKERMKENGDKAHATQKPEALLYRVLLASTNPGDVVLDPFFGTGTTGAAAARLGRNWIGIERDLHYVELSRARIAALPLALFDPAVLVMLNPRREPRIPFGALLEHDLLQPGQVLYFGRHGTTQATILADGSLECAGQRGSIHKLASLLLHGPGNGWTLWYYQDPASGERKSIDDLRKQLRALQNAQIES